jgi:hypothetical protein
MLDLYRVPGAIIELRVFIQLRILAQSERNLSSFVGRVGWKLTARLLSHHAPMT